MENIKDMVPEGMEFDEFYMEVRPDGAIIKRTVDGAKVLHFHDDVLTFHSPEGFTLYEMNEANKEEDRNDHINFLLDTAWDNPGFGERLEQASAEFVMVLAHLENNDA